MPQIPKPQMAYLGVDPGKSGGFALSAGQKIESYEPTPDSDLDMLFWLRSTKEKYPNIKCMIERVHSMPGEGHVGVFSFGENYGKLQMAVMSVDIPYELVTPRTWQAGLGVKVKEKTESKPQFKERLRQHAQQLFPSLPLWDGKGKLGLQRSVCDAILIAEYCRRKNEGLLK